MDFDDMNWNDWNIVWNSFLADDAHTGQTPVCMPSIQQEQSLQLAPDISSSSEEGAATGLMVSSGQNTAEAVPSFRELGHGARTAAAERKYAVENQLGSLNDFDTLVCTA